MWPFYDIMGNFIYKGPIRKSFKEKCKDVIEDVEFEEITEQEQESLLEELKSDNTEDVK